MTKRKASFLTGTAAAKYQLPAEDHRLNHSGLWTPAAGNPLAVASGVVWGPGNPGAVSVVAGGVSVTPFHAAIQGTRSGVQGVFEVTSDAVEFLAIVAASSTTFWRGRLGVRVYDLLNGADKDLWDIEVLYGDPAATAGAALLPAVPADSTWFELRQFAVSSTGVVTLTGRTPRTMPRGAILPVEEADDTPGSYVGQYRDHPSGRLQRWNGNSWGQPIEDTGWVNVGVRATFGANGVPRVRRIGSVVHCVDGFSNAGMVVSSARDVGDVPVGFRPAIDRYMRAGVDTGARQGGIIVTTEGVVNIRTAETLSSYYRMDPCTWLVN